MTGLSITDPRRSSASLHFHRLQLQNSHFSFRPSGKKKKENEEVMGCDAGSLSFSSAPANAVHHSGFVPADSQTCVTSSL